MRLTWLTLLIVLVGISPIAVMANGIEEEADLYPPIEQAEPVAPVEQVPPPPVVQQEPTQPTTTTCPPVVPVCPPAVPTYTVPCPPYGAAEGIPFRRWDVHAGVGFLMGDADSSTTWIVGVGYQMPLSQDIFDIGQATLFTASVDYYPVDVDDNGDDDTVGVFPVLVGLRWYTPFAGYPVFFGVGVGARFATDDIDDLDIDTVNFAWNAELGVDISRNFFGRLRFIGGTNPGDDGIFSIELGYRF